MEPVPWLNKLEMLSSPGPVVLSITQEGSAAYLQDIICILTVTEHPALQFANLYPASTGFINAVEGFRKPPPMLVRHVRLHMCHLRGIKHRPRENKKKAEILNNPGWSCTKAYTGSHSHNGHGNSTQA